MSGGQSGEGSSSAVPQASGSTGRKEVHQLNESLYELHRPEGTPSMILLFCHGLQLGDDFSDAHVSTWTTADGTIWPREWLVEYFPGAHILTVSYRAEVGSGSGGSKDDLYVIVENLISDLMQANIGQTQYCPIVLVGHCFGGLVIKELCLESSKPIKNWREGETAKPKTFLDNVRGIFYYGTPHHGSPFVSTQPANVHDSPLLEYFRTLSAKAGRLNHEFDQLRRSYGNWSVHALGENLRTKSALFGDSVAVPEASSREGDTFNVVEADHISISKPKNQVDRRFYALKDLLHDIAINLRKEAREREEIHAKDARPENFQYLPEHVVDIDAQVLKIKSKLETVKILGLTGMGGVGKTTLAMAVFNNLGPTFEYSCFLRDVKVQGNVDKVKDAIWERMHYCGKKVEGGINFSKLRGQRLLLVLDDISDRDGEVLSELVRDTALESRFITTSRQHDLLNNLGKIHEVPFLNESSARRLFMEHAFQLQTAPSEFESICEAIVKKCDGLPLTLEVLGKFLKKKENYEDWKQTLNALDNAESVTSLDERLWGKLRLSYNGLGPKEQQMFLDATTFFSNNRSWKLCQAKAAWRTAYKMTSESLYWQTLVDMSLVYNVEEDDHIKVHEQMQSLGRRIASEPAVDGKHRVRDWKAALKILRSNKKESRKEIYALQLNRSRYNSLSGPAREDGDFHHDDCAGCHSTNDNSQDGSHNRIGSIALCKLEKLRFFEADVPIIIDRVNEHASVPAKLVLLRCVGDHLFNPAIQTRLVILHLSGVKSIPSSIGHLTVLQHLEITDSTLQELPSSFGRLKSLQHLLFKNCHQLESLPESFGHLSALKHLKLSFGQLSSLNHLEFFRCSNSQTLPESFGQLSALKHLEFYDCNNLHTLPESFGQLSALNHLVFNDCNNLHTLPESFGQLSALKHLEFTACDNLHTLAESFGQLSALNHLVFNDCNNLHTLPESFGQLSSLNHLVFDNCNNLHTLPESFGQLSALNHLEFTTCDNLHTLAESFGQLSALKHLEFYSCNNLHTLPESFGQLSALKHLDFYKCGNLHTLPESLGQLFALKHLEFYSCNNLHTLPESFGQLSALKHLEFYSCNNLHTLPESFGQLSTLNHLQLQNCNNLPESFGQLSALNSLEFYDCNNLHTLAESFGQLSALKHLEFNRCDNLHTLPESFGQLSALQHLEFNECGNLQTLPGSFRQLSALEHLIFDNCNNLHTLAESFGQLSALEHLVFDNCNNLHTLPESCGQLSALQRLEFNECGNLHTLPESFGQLSALEHLEFNECANLHTLPESFWQLSVVEHLKFRGCYNLYPLPRSFGLPTRLQYLQICAMVEMSPLKDLTDLCDLEIGSHSTKSIADFISRLSSFHEPDVLCLILHSLAVCFHNDVVKRRPPPGHLWTVPKRDNIVKQLWMTLQVQDGGFCLKEISLHSRSGEVQRQGVI